jgi:hypothetical protein
MLLFGDLSLSLWTELLLSTSLYSGSTFCMSLKFQLNFC